ncbi:MAG: hypothetical protein WBC70_16040 [Candidatus Aminicenantales bacterium]
MVFRIIAVLSIAGLAGRLTYLRFREATILGGAQAGSFSRIAYFQWLSRNIMSLFGTSGRRSLRALYDYCLTFHPTPLMKAVFTGLVWSSIFLALSGIGFALFSPRGLFGIFLLLHVVAGGIFSVCLAADIVLRAKEYQFALEVLTLGRRSLRSFLDGFSSPLHRSLLYWGFVLAGFILIVTALVSMVPYFSFRAQLAFVETHRWSALAAVLIAMAFLEAVLPHPQK